MNEKIRLQPLLDITKNLIFGYEALSIKNTEDSYPSAEYILRKVVSNVEAHGNFKLFINMTVNDVIEKDFSKNFLRTLYKLGIDGKRVILEVSENTRPEMLPEVKHTLNALRTHNVKIALDDFGTQYSTLEFIKELPLDIVKIDKSFVQNASHNNKNKALLNFYVDVFHDLGCKVVAEGIETKEQLDIVKESKTDIAQGFLFSVSSYCCNKKENSPFIKLSDFSSYISKNTCTYNNIQYHHHYIEK